MTPTARTIHHIAREQRHLAWDNSIEPVLRIASGETVTIDAVEASGGQLGPDSTIDDMARLDFAACDPVQGPIYVQDAQPGDTLQIEMLDLETADWGWTAIIPGFGLLADEFAEPALKIWKLQDGFAEFVPGIRLPLEPFCGEIGVAPAETGAFSTIPPGPNGGNIDTKHLTKGATIYLPVLAPGALFSIGDGHAAQGDGEVCGTAIETPMRITLRLTVRKDLHVPELQYCTAGPLTPRTNIAPYYATTGHGPDLMEAARNAVRNMIEYLERTYGLSRANAYMLCSVAADLKINEIVDAPNWIVGAYMPTSIFTGMGRS
ncbi:MAG: acetamidase [Chloroflexi bacterium]|nr:MAG: acetamidase [Chloroflexota bacterium]